MTRTPPLGYAVAHFGRLTLTSRDYATVEAACECGDDESYFLPDAKQRKALLARHGFDADDLVSRWLYLSRREGDDQRDAAVETWQEHFQMGACR